MENIKEKQKLSASAEYRKRFILEEIEKMDERNIGLIYAFMLGRSGRTYLASGGVK
ncbi:MAG: hypothetical protein SPF03_08145 [Faecalimonas umbilicata]|uniref:hypothetical protein n=1 Tax=Faecalimonas umbilicata TaxID=1912855 RepID=UPI002430432B|nr:hypothetical protein [Faecalimonas umbilicata]MCI5987145.1 hypothetical protein [Faecalimonas umbilicata]MDY5093467.1 hypothetical protein [Faecalimonas umbilicata]